MVTTRQIRCIVVHVADETTSMESPAPTNRLPRFRPSDLVPWTDPCIAGLINKLQNEVRDEQPHEPNNEPANEFAPVNRLSRTNQPLKNFEEGKYLTDDRWVDRLLSDLDLKIETEAEAATPSNSAYWDLDSEFDFAFPSDVFSTESDTAATKEVANEDLVNDFDATEEEAYYADLLRADIEELDVDIFFDHNEWR